MLCPILVLLAVLSLANAAQLQLYHRLLHPTDEDPRFLPCGTLSYSQTSLPVVEPALTLAQELAAFDEAALPGSLYQVALQRDGDRHAGHWAISSVKLCHVAQSTSDALVLHVTPDGAPYALDYFIAPVPHDGACPKSRRAAAAAATHFVPLANTTISVRAPRVPPLPELRAPPPLTPQGAPVQPVPEKSFLQKYWMYIVAILLALALSGGQDPEQGSGGGRAGAGAQ